MKEKSTAESWVFEMVWYEVEGMEPSKVTEKEIELPARRAALKA